ncbi:hypothetical protein ACXWTA_09465, partial [Streptococcus pyogenes]
ESVTGAVVRGRTAVRGYGRGRGRTFFRGRGRVTSLSGIRAVIFLSTEEVVREGEEGEIE